MERSSSTLCRAFFLMLLAVVQSTATATPADLASLSTDGPEFITELSTELSTEFITELTGEEVTKQTAEPPSVLEPPTTTAPDVLCGEKVCNASEECVPVGDSSVCQCLTNYIRINGSFCQDPATAVCSKIDCGEPPATCASNDTFPQCRCGEYQTLKEGLCIAFIAENPSTVSPTTEPGADTTANPAANPTKKSTAPTEESSKPVTDETDRPTTGGSTKAVEKETMKITDKATQISGDTTSVKPDNKTMPSHRPYTGPIIGLFIFLVVTSLVFAAIYVVRKRKLRNNYGRLDEDSSESGWSAFSKNPIYRGDRDYQPL